MRILIKNGRVIDPGDGRDCVETLYIEDDKITAEFPEVKADRVVDAKGCYVMPGLVDMHVHLRDPGLTYKEDIVSGARAAARGGVTTVVAMPNTKPVMDSPDRISYVANKARALACVNIIQAGAVTKGQKGQELADYAGMARIGVPAVSEDGRSVMNARLMREAMAAAQKENLVILDHCEDGDLVNGGCINADENARRLGLPGITNSVEDTITARDIVLAGETGCRLHLCHVSTRGAAELLRYAKAQGMAVTGEVCPHHFTLTSDDIPERNSNYKMNPPLRSREDKEALIEGLQDGTFDVISTDHAPHARQEKGPDMRSAAFGIVGLETSVALTITELVDKGILTPMQMAEKMSYNPAKILGIDRGTLAEGAVADVVVIDPDAVYVIDASSFASRGRNTPFDGRKVKGKVRMTICGGEIVYQENRQR
ncbi:MAG: dihydroorotase [Lachnospiraceae bacterium]|nr:dihydroorotase [Lachnospiraceae bacterium]